MRARPTDIVISIGTCERPARAVLVIHFAPLVVVRGGRKMDCQTDLFDDAGEIYAGLHRADDQLDGRATARAPDRTGKLTRLRTTCSIAWRFSGCARIRARSRRASRPPGLRASRTTCPSTSCAMSGRTLATISVRSGSGRRSAHGRAPRHGSGPCRAGSCPRSARNRAISSSGR